MKDEIIQSDTAKIAFMQGLGPAEADFPDYTCTQTALARWLRETHDLFVCVLQVPGPETWYQCYVMRRKTCLWKCWLGPESQKLYSTYEAALEKALQQALLHVKQP